jgi:PAS domain S-box-containing protein
MWTLSVLADRRSVLKGAEANLDSTARLLEQHADRAFVAGDRAVQAAVAAVGDPAGLRAQGRAAALHERLRVLVADSRQLSSAWIMDRDGIALVESWSEQPSSVGSYAHRPYFQAHQAGERGMLIGSAARGSVSGRTRFTLSRPLEAPDGDFAGIAVAGVYSDYFGAIYAEAGLGDGAQFALFRVDGARLVAWPPAEGGDGSPTDTLTMPEDLPAPGAGVLRVTGDGRLEAIRRLDRFPVVLAVTQPLEAVLAEWRRRTGLAALVLAAVLAMLTALAAVGRRGAARQQALTAALQEERTALERRVAERTAALQESEARFREMADHAPVMVWVTDAGGHCTFLGQSWYEFTGQALHAGEGMGWLDVVHPDDRAAVRATTRAALAAQEGFRLEYRIRRAEDGAWRFALGFGAPRRDAAGKFLGYIGSSMDITERREAEERQALMARELDHRAKNALTVVQAALRLTPRHDADGYAMAVEGRVAALARAHSALAEGHWRGVRLRSLLEAELATFAEPGGAAAGAQRVVLQGPDIVLTPPAVQALSMAVHELATNATKYGALGARHGRLSVAWWHDEAAGMLRLRWEERDGPEIADAPRRRGFGARVIQATIAGQLGGKAERIWDRDGMVCLLALPLARVTNEGRVPLAAN